MKKIVFFIIFCFAISSCEKDDICDPTTPTTPKLVISFFDATTNAPKNVTNLTIQEFGNATAYKTFDAVNKITIPLKTTADIVKYRLILNNTNPTTAITNEDILQFNYSRNNVFISRACGYKTLFNLTNNPILTDPNITPNYWIQNLIVQTTNISTENETHIKIYFN